MSVNIIGAGIGAQCIGGDPEHYEWRVSYERDGKGVGYHKVSSRRARDSEEAVRVAKRDLGQQD